MREQDKTSKKENKAKINNLPDKEFTVIVIKMFTRLERRVDELRTSTKRWKKRTKQS